MTNVIHRLTTLTHGGGCACKIPPGVLDSLLSPLLSGPRAPDLVVGPETSDDAAVVAVNRLTNIVSTIDYFAPVVDDPYDWGQIAASNALSDVYAMGGLPIVALNVLAWPTSTLPMDLAAAVLKGGQDKCAEVSVPIGGGHSIDVRDEPLYGLAVTGLVNESELLTNDSAEVGLPLTLTKPLGIGIACNFHKQTGEAIPEAIMVMKQLNADARNAAVAQGASCATDVTGFGLLGHALKLALASQVTVEINAALVAYVDGTRELANAGYVSGGSIRNLEWVRPHLAVRNKLSELDLIMLADAQTSGGLLVVGEVPGYPIIGAVKKSGSARLQIV